MIRHRHSRKIAGIVCLMLALTMPAANSESQTESDKWRWTGKLYLWASGIDGTTATGGDIDVSFGDLLENLDFALMGGVETTNGQWSVIGDLIYMDLSGDGTSSLPGPGPIEISAKAGLEGWVAHLLGAYNVMRSDTNTVDLTFGGRYLDIDVDLNAQTMLPPPGIDFSGGVDVVDAVIGIRGGLHFYDNFYLPYIFDIGTGQSDMTWQAMAGIGWQPSWGEITLFYRLLGWDFDGKDALDDIAFSGPGLMFMYHFN